jgi:plasmid maintenance system killer protein
VTTFKSIRLYENYRIIFSFCSHADPVRIMSVEVHKIRVVGL